MFPLMIYEAALKNCQKINCFLFLPPPLMGSEFARGATQHKLNVLYTICHVDKCFS